MNVTVRKIASVSCSAEEWGLRDRALANHLNLIIEDVFNKGGSRRSAELQTWKLMRAFVKSGAMETRPRKRLREILGVLYT